MARTTLKDRVSAIGRTFQSLRKTILGRRSMSLAEWDALMDAAITGQATFAGVTVTETQALNLSAVWNAVTIISGTLASLPLILYRRTGSNRTNKERAPGNPLFNTLHNQANPLMTSFTWREVSEQHRLLWGNCYSLIIRNALGFVVELWPIHPSRIKPEFKNGDLIYVRKMDDGTELEIPKEKILHIPGMGADGYFGYSVISQMARQSIGTALAADEHAGRVFAQGGTLRGVLLYPGKLSDREGAKENLRKQWDEVYSGVSNAGKVALLEEGMKFQPLSMSPGDLQLLDTRTFNILEVARWFNLQAHKLKELTHATFSNIEQQQIEFVQDTIRPIAERWESHIHWKLINEEEKDTFFAEFLLDALLRGDFESRNKGFSVMRQNGALNADEWRAMLNMNEIEDGSGKTYWMPLNMVDAANPAPSSPASTEDGDIEEEEDERAHQHSDEMISVKSMRSINERKRVARAHRKLFFNAMKRVLQDDRPKVEKIAKLLEELSDLDRFDIFEENIRILEAQETQQLLDVAGERTETAAITPASVSDADSEVL